MSGGSSPHSSFERLRTLFDEATHGEFSLIPDVLAAIEEEAREITFRLEEQLEAEREKNAKLSALIIEQEAEYRASNPATSTDE